MKYTFEKTTMEIKLQITQHRSIGKNNDLFQKVLILKSRKFISIYFYLIIFVLNLVKNYSLASGFSFSLKKKKYFFLIV